jgi:triosephosphate isomerase
MRKKIAAGNWKMNGVKDEAMLLASAIINDESIKNTDAEIILGAPFIYLEALVKLTTNDKNIKIAAQNCASEIAGAYTGEVSAAMLASVGVDAVIVGHSERRSIFNEDNVILAKKVDLVIANNMQPIFCFGEKLEERNHFQHFNIIESQLWEGVFHLPEEDFLKCVLAYEPVWAIGTGVTASAAQAQEMHQFIRSLVAEKYSADTANAITILYGGSCNEKNAKELFALADVDGGLIGGASLKAESFLSIIKSF